MFSGRLNLRLRIALPFSFRTLDLNALLFRRMTAKRFNIPHSLSPLSEHIYNFLLRRRRRMLFTSLQRASFSRIPFSSD